MYTEQQLEAAAQLWVRYFAAEDMGKIIASDGSGTWNIARDARRLLTPVPADSPTLAAANGSDNNTASG